MKDTVNFNYTEAFRINLGLFSETEQHRLRDARVLIAGTGGAGGVIAIMLARSGVGHFTLIDPDVYTLSNINRQIGCFVDTIGRSKAEVIKEEILRINPLAGVLVYNKIVPLEKMEELLTQADVYFSEADDLAYSTCSLLLAQKLKVMSISYMPMGMAGYIMVFPPDLPRNYDPTDMFGGPKISQYDELKEFQNNPVNRSGRRWHITEGKMRVDWFRKWCKGENTLTQLCPAVWIGTALASIEAVKYLTGKWKKVRAPKMWHVDLANNRINVSRFRRRTWLFSKYIYWAVNIKWLGIGNRIKQISLKTMDKELSKLEQQEEQGKEAALPFAWKHII
ncbi:MAG: ThiF family adenylyltransferase [Dehalococcoidales bacterium]|nr:ThiF family adenylyltransferase [Dehalococcoidales bacterium]